jgi:hypothetical protein
MVTLPLWDYAEQSRAKRLQVHMLFQPKVEPRLAQEFEIGLG